MTVSFKARCERIRLNNGITEVLFTRHANFSGEVRQDEHVLVNIHVEKDLFKQDEDYLIDIYPAEQK